MTWRRVDRSSALPGEGEEQAAVADILVQAFAMPPQDTSTWIEKAGLSNLRVLRERGTVTATALPIPMGQWFGGRRVAMAGIGGVGVAPGARGSGSATRLMQRTLQELRSLGFPSPSSTRPPSRSTGAWATSRLGPVRDPRPGLAPGLQGAQPPGPAGEAGRSPALQELYRRYASTRQGYLDRGPYMLDRVFHPRGETAYGFVLEGAQGLEGYVWLVRRRKVDPPAGDLPHGLRRLSPPRRGGGCCPSWAITARWPRRWCGRVARWIRRSC